ncbi:MAG: hypothetical protein EZS28_008986 [Streblomastix strix]|uniref:Tyr recombinase domain-containing protein n=1 Tax=Streblomastix strix TaxID=222440 RepID=A0A5J4WKA6_9EUKA|nr:MAG: hypothetical protein EZS28_008986 [Streblomastix strix]
MEKDRGDGISINGSVRRLEESECQRIIGQEQKDNRSQRFSEVDANIRGGIEERSGRWDSERGIREGCDALESIIHQTQTKWEISENYRLPSSEQGNKWHTLQDGRSQGYNGLTGAGGLYDCVGSRGCIPSYQGESRSQQVLRIQVQRKGLPVLRPSLWIYSKPSNILSDSQSCNQLNQGPVANQVGNVYGRLAIDCEGQIKIGVRYNQSSRNSQKVGMEDSRKQMSNEAKHQSRILGMALGYSELDSQDANKEKEGDGKESEMLDEMDVKQEISTCSGNCSVLRRTELPANSNGGCISSLIIDQSNEDRSTEDERMEQQILSDKKNERRFVLVEELDQIKRGTKFLEEDSITLSNNGCMRNGLGIDAGGYARISGADICLGNLGGSFKPQIVESEGAQCCSDELKTFCNQSIGGRCALHSNGQFSDRILLKEVENERNNASIVEESQKGSNLAWNQDLNRTHSRNSESDNRQLEQDGIKRRLQTGSDSTTEGMQRTATIPNDRWLRESNQQVTKKILQLVKGRQRSKAGCVQPQLGERVFLTSSTNKDDIEDIEKDFGRQSNCTCDPPTMERLNMERAVETVNCQSDNIGEVGNDSDTWSDDDSESTETSTGRAPRSKDDRHWPGEMLFRRMLESTGLQNQSIDVVIGSMSTETWRKRRAGIHILNDFLEEQKISLEQLRQMRADVTLVNALTWRNNKGGNKCLQDLRKLKKHGGIALAMFYNTDDVSKLPLVVSAAKKFELAIKSKAKYTTMWDLDILLSYMVKQDKLNGKKLMGQTMASFVAFTAERMTELTRMIVGGVIFNDEGMIVKIKVKKGKKEIEYEVQVNRQKNKICLVESMKRWLNDVECLKGEEDAVWYDLEKKKKLSPQACSTVLRKILDEIGIDKQYGGATIRHAMMSKLRKQGASIEEVNAFTRHAPGSNVVDVYYNKPVGRDLSTLLLLGGNF